MTITGQPRLMEIPPGAPFSGSSFWKRLLITAFFFSCWIHPTSAQGALLTVVPNPPYGTVGGSIILDIIGFSEQALSYIWYRKARRNQNQIAFYNVRNRVQRPANIQEKVFANGSLLIPDLTLRDTNDYIVLINSRRRLRVARGHLTVYEKSLEVSNGSSLSGGAITGIVFGILIGATLFGVFIYFYFFRDRAIKYQRSEKNHSARKHGEDITLYENNICLQGSLLPAQDLGSSPAFPEVPLESSYQTLDITRVDVYDKIYPWKPKA